MGEYSLADGLLDSIPILYSLNGRQMAEYEMYESILPFLRQVSTDTVGLASIDSAQLETLLGIASADSLMPGVFARNILIHKGISDYLEPVLEPDNLKSSRSWRKTYGDNKSEKNNLDQVYPNPTRNYCMVKLYHRNPEQKNKTGMLYLTDLMGRRLFGTSVRADQHYYLVPLKDLPAGQYFIHLILSGAPPEVIKIVKQY
jgi:hypothetical protein